MQFRLLNSEDSFLGTQGRNDHWNELRNAYTLTIDWTIREDVRAYMRVLVKRILRRHGYPPDKQEKATQTVLEQAALLSEAWAVA